MASFLTVEKTFYPHEICPKCGLGAVQLGRGCLSALISSATVSMTCEACGNAWAIPEAAVKDQKLQSEKFKAFQLGHGGFDGNVVGESHYTRTLDVVAARSQKSGDFLQFDAIVQREPDNPYDENAVRVLAFGVFKVGHLSRKDAKRYLGPLKSLEELDMPAGCQAILVGGTPERPNYGVRLKLAAPKAILTGIQLLKEKQGL